MGILQLVKSIGKNHYDHQKLYQDILKLNKDKHLYSLVAIKNTFDEYSNKFLLYYDEEWQVEFFPAFRTVNNDVYNIDNIKKRLSENLKIKADKIDVTFLIEKTNRTKPSAEDEIEKVYDHRYYQATISEFPDCLKESTTIIDGRRYIWMTFQDMKKNTNIMKKNKDIIQIFEEYIK